MIGNQLQSRPNFKLFFQAYEKNMGYSEVSPLLRKLFEFLVQEGLVADEKCKTIWPQEINNITLLKNCIKENCSIEVLKERSIDYEKNSIFIDKIEYLNFKTQLFKSEQIKDVEWVFNILYDLITRGAICFERSFPKFWENELNRIQDLCTKVWRINQNYQELILALEYYEDVSYYSTTKEFKELKQEIIDYQPSQNSRERSDVIEHKYGELNDLVQKEYEYSGVKITQKTKFIDDSIDEEIEVMRAFRNVNQDHFDF